ncbi:flagellar type III secretion system protein FliR [Heyndrickxia oleronia]|jgi:flagellar biosynthetic protein FliR|uniref:flagellar biosynthetic protein FliR n=1 Tax=Heyndrickxia oleronia TaxID=38875 RepID=UPI000903170A|nr:flagellar biosynthetic protein FliR [Heyndrickxia oleronia]MBU5211128.1 flagellar type III secretion system protein FliR [Heyndrickxia oleronia]MCM3454168.1 flagellar type III secretion system protein FliR [Heyndrickxia oleronia]OJH18066.1 flagellar biosynthetic protein FliR [Bacillus obstructivus]
MAQLIPSFSVFLLIFVRVSAFFVTMPLFSYRTIPAIYRIGFAFLLAWLMYYTLDVPGFEIDAHYFMLIIKEAMVGLFIGFIAYLILAAIQIAGGFIDFQMGFAIANVIDPQTGTQSPLMGQYLYSFALLLLLALNGHHLILDGIFYSYNFIPIDKAIPFGNGDLIEFIIKAFSKMFVIAFQMSIPVVASLFLVDIALGIIARTVPQLNIFVVGFPVKIAVSFIVLIIVMGVIFSVSQRLFELMFYTMRDVMKLVGGT